MRLPSLLLFVAASCAFVHGDCDRVSTLPTNILSEREYVVRLSQNCEDHTTDSPIFCEDSGWGDEEANVVCKSKMNTTYGLGDYIMFAETDYQVGYAHVYCMGYEDRLEDCEVGNLTSHNCSYLGIARCLDVPQVLVSRGKSYQYFERVEIFENETADFCVIVWGPLSQPLHVLVETTDNGAAVANFDYRPLQQTVTFEPTKSLRSQQCLKIELIDDSLAEFWEMFSVTISTNSSTVNLTRREFNVFIGPNDGECIEGNVTGSTNGRLRLVEMCNSDGVWSPICDNEWTQEDATVVCRELGYQKPKSVRYETINKTMVNAIHTNISCRGNETALRDCVSTEPPVNTVCQLALVDCSPDVTVIVDPEVEDPNDGDTGGVRMLAGVLSAVLLLVILTVAVGIVVGLKCQRRGQVKITTPHNPAYNVVQSKHRGVAKPTQQGTSEGRTNVSAVTDSHHSVCMQSNLYNVISSQTQTSEELEYDYVQATQSRASRQTAAPDSSRMRFPLLLLFIAASCAFVHGDCDRVSTLPTNISEREYVVRLSQNCEDHTTDSPIFCEDSGWGDEEANVVCKSKINTTYGLGVILLHIISHQIIIGFADTDYQVGYAHVYCKGDEERLEDCEVGNLTSHNCSYLGIARCLDGSCIQGEKSYQYFERVEIFENETADFCVIVWGPLSQPLHVLVETTDSGAAVANFDYRPLQQTVTFEPTESLRSQQCLKIELIDDSLAEFWEMFSVTISTNSSTVNLTRREFNVFIGPNDGECIEGNVTGSTNGRLQLVEMCNSDGVWSPICDNEWTQEDATVVCRELGYQEPKSVRYETINKTMVNATHISCRGNETALRDCVSTEPPVNTVCQLA
ncbi:Neurotrypsin, partial [Geodia barretti]